MFRSFLLAGFLAAILSVHAKPTALFAQDSEVIEKRAFLVGVAKYHKDGLPDLTYSEDDMKVLGEELKKQGFTVTLLLGESATRKRVNESLEKFVEDLGDLKKTDVALIGFSGHGQQRQVENNGRLEEDAFFCPVDALKDDAKTLISIGQLMDNIQKQSGSSQNLLIVDACRNNPAKGAKGIDGGTARNLGNKISVLYSSTDGMRSFEASKVQHGLFTYILLEGLRGEAASRNGDVTWLNLASYVMDAVPERAAELLDDPQAEQRPNLIGNLVRQPVLARLDTTAPLKSPAAPRKSAFDQKALARAIQLREENKEELAMSAFDDLIERFPTNAIAYIERAVLHSNMGKHLRAIADSESALELEPNNLYALSTRGYAFMVTGDHDRAIADFNRAIEIDPKFHKAYYQRGSTYSMKGDLDRALSDCNQAISLNAKDSYAYAHRGFVYSAREEPQNAIADFNRAIELNPRDVYSLCNRGREYSNKGEYALGMADFNRSLEINPKFAESLIRRASAYNAQKMYDLAIADCDKAIGIKPKDVWAVRNRASAYLGKADYVRALEDYNRAIELAPNDPTSYHDRAIANHTKGDVDAAVADYSKTLSMNPQVSTALHGRARIYYAKDNYDSAMADYNRTIELAPNTAAAWNERGNIWYVKQNDAQAMADYKKSCELDNASFGNTFLTIGDLGKSNQTFDRAILYYTEAIRRNPKSAAAYGGRGYCRHMLKQYAAAIKDYDKAIKYDPGNAKYKSNRSKAQAAR